MKKTISMFLCILSVVSFIQCNKKSNIGKSNTNRSDIITPKIIGAVSLSATQVMLTYSEDVDPATAEDPANYAYDANGFGIDIDSVILQSDNSMVLVVFAAGLSINTHTIKVQKVQDIENNSIIENNIDNTQSFIVYPPSITPRLVGVVAIFSDASETRLMLTFSENVESATANVSSNYAYDTNSFGVNITSAARQSNNAMVLVVLTPGLSRGAHEIKVQNVTDLIGNSIIQNGIDNILSFMVYPPTGLTEGPVFTDPFSDGTDFSMFTKYDSKIYLGTNNESAKLFEMNYGMNTINTILLDADGTVGSPIQDFDGYGSLYSSTIYGIDAIYSACADGTSTPDLTGPACSAAGGTETMFIGGLNIAGYYDSYWISNDVSTTSTTFTFSEQQNPDVNGGTYAYRSTVFTLFKDQLWNHFGAENGGGGRGGRVCMKATGCNDGTVFLSGVQLSYIYRIKRIGADLTNNSLPNGSDNNNTFGGQVPAELRVLNAINVSYEHDNDGTDGNESQLYIGNGGFYAGPLGSPRTGSSDGGIVRTTLAYSTRSSLPLNCPPDTSGCSTYWEDVTPDTISDWNSFVSIMLPQNSNVTGAANCGTSSIEMDCVVPYNTFTPSMKAIPYMRTAPNGDLYMLRNACSSQIACLNGKADCDFRTVKQTCLPGSEVPQLWMMPKNCGTAADCSTKWKLVAEYDTTGKSSMQGNVAGCGTAPNKCQGNTQATLIEFVGNYLYIGFDNPMYGVNLWRTDMSAVISGNIPDEASFDLVSDFGFDATLTNTKIFNHITFNDASKDWLLISTGNGVVPVRVYRTSNTTE